MFIKSTFGYAFWQGNCTLSEGTDKVVRASVERKLRPKRGGLQGINESLWAARHEAGYLDDIALTARRLPRTGGSFRTRSVPGSSFNALGRSQRKSGPIRRTLQVRRLRYFVFFDETNPKTRSLIYRVSHLGLTLAAALGLVLAHPDVRRRLGPTVIAAGLIALFHTLTIVSVRFHVPIEPLLGLWAGASLSLAGTALNLGSSR